MYFYGTQKQIYRSFCEVVFAYSTIGKRRRFSLTGGENARKMDLQGGEIFCVPGCLAGLSASAIDDVTEPSFACEKVCVWTRPTPCRPVTKPFHGYSSSCCCCYLSHLRAYRHIRRRLRWRRRIFSYFRKNLASFCYAVFRFFVPKTLSFRCNVLKTNLSTANYHQIILITLSVCSSAQMKLRFVFYLC